MDSDHLSFGRPPPFFCFPRIKITPVTLVYVWGLLMIPNLPYLLFHVLLFDLGLWTVLFW